MVHGNLSIVSLARVDGPLSSSDQLTALLGVPTVSYFLTLKCTFFSPYSILWYDPPLDILPPWVRIAFSLFPCSVSLPFLQFHFHVTIVSFSPSLSFIIYQFLLLFLCPPLLCSLLCPSCTLAHFSSCPSVPQFSTERLCPPPQI